MAESARERAARLNTGNKFSGNSYSVINGQVVQRKDGYNLGGQSDWKNLDGSSAGAYQKPATTTTSGIDPGILFPFGDHVDANGNLKAGGKGIGQYLYPFGDNVDANGNIKPRAAKSGGYYGPGGNRDGSGQDQAQQSPGIGPYQGHTPGLPRPSQPADERTTTNGNGVTQTMKAMSSTSTPIDMARSFDSLLDARSSQPFSSNQLPTTAGSPDANIGPVTDGQEYANNLGRQGTKGIGPVADGQVYGNMLQGGRVKGDQNIGPVANGQEYAESLGKGGRLSDALNDKAGINSYMEKFSGGDKQRAASMAFLNAKDSMSGLKARDEVNDVVYAGGQHYGRGALSEDAGIGDKYKIDRADARGIASGETTAAGLLDTYKSRIKDAQKSTPAEAQDPLSAAGSAVKSGFAAAAKTDRKLQGKSAARDGVLGGILAGAKTDFDLNNSI